MLNTAEAEFGVGPWSARRSDEDHMIHLYFGEELHVGEWGPYPLMKTAAKRCRQLNASQGNLSYIGIVAGLDLSGTVEEVMERYPDPAPPKPKRPKIIREPKVKHGAAAQPSVTASFEGTREQWLNAFVERSREAFKRLSDHELPKVRVSIGFTGARGKGVLGACWHEEASTDGTREIFVVPTIDDSVVIAGILTHELCHSLFGKDEKHGKNFRAAGLAMGLRGKSTCMGATPELLDTVWHEWADPVLADLGPIPHARLDPSKSGVKKQTTRLLKAECPTCKFVFRVTAKWVNAISERGETLECPDPECYGGEDMRSRMCVELPASEEGE